MTTNSLFPVFVRYVIALSMSVLIVVRLAHALIHSHRHGSHIIEVGRESEEFWVPGDRLPSDIEDANEED